jgi:hypothetical protein
MHWAARVHTAAEIVHECADGEKSFMGMQTTRPGGVVRDAIGCVWRRNDARSDLDVECWIEHLVAAELPRIPEGIGDHAGIADDVVAAFMGVPVNPQPRPKLAHGGCHVR